MRSAAFFFPSRRKRRLQNHPAQCGIALQTPFFHVYCVSSGAPVSFSLFLQKLKNQFPPLYSARDSRGRQDTLSFAGVEVPSDREFCAFFSFRQMLFKTLFAFLFRPVDPVSCHTDAVRFPMPSSFLPPSIRRTDTFSPRGFLSDPSPILSPPPLLMFGGKVKRIAVINLISAFPASSIRDHNIADQVILDPLSFLMFSIHATASRGAPLFFMTQSKRMHSPTE